MEAIEGRHVAAVLDANRFEVTIFALDPDHVRDVAASVRRALSAQPGATVVAAATSLPDAVISVRGARRGDGDLSMGNVLGSNIFDLLVAIPAGVLVAGEAPVDFGVAAPLMGFLTLATIALFAFMRTRLRLTRTEGVLLLVLYAAFVGWLILETVGVTQWAR